MMNQENDRRASSSDGAFGGASMADGPSVGFNCDMLDQGDLESRAAAFFHSLPTMPPSRRAGIWDLYLVDLDDGRDLDRLPIPGTLLNGPTPVDGILVVILNISIRLAADVGEKTSENDQEQMILAATESVAPMNARWYASGQLGTRGSDRVPRSFSRCLIHVAVRATFDDVEADASPLTCRVLLSRGGAARTFWETDGKSPALSSGSLFELDVPPQARARITIRNLISRIDEFHALDPLHLPRRISLVREIRKGARAFAEVENEIGETWDSDTFTLEADFPAEKAAIERSLAYCREAEAEELSERAARLEDLRAQLERFAGGDSLMRGWRATRYTVEIDAALSTFHDLPHDAYGVRLDMLGEVQTRCKAFVAMVQGRKRLFNRHLHALLPAVEGLMQRVRETKGEFAVLRGISVLKPLVEAKHVELSMLRATGALAQRCLAVEAALIAEENSLCLRVMLHDEADMVSTLRECIQARLPSMLGIEKVPEDVRGEDLRPMVRHVIPIDTAVWSISSPDSGD